MKCDYARLIKLLKEILYILESGHTPFIQLDRNDGGLMNQIKSAIGVLRKEGK